MMNRATLSLFTEAERSLLEQTTKEALAGLAEDALCDLHLLVRRARTKYVKLYRRQASAQVARDGSRGIAASKNQRTAAKAEVFEEALARVSRRLAEVARISAAELRAERLAAARLARAQAASKTRRPALRTQPVAGKKLAARSVRPIEKKVAAATRAGGGRAQAKRDSR
jgi:hypothetical protein